MRYLQNGWSESETDTDAILYITDFRQSGISKTVIEQNDNVAPRL